MKRKILVTLSACLLICTMVVGGTLAYFTDVTEEKENVFTVGGVDIDLEEPGWDEDKAHNIAPGVDFEKDPTITIADGSDDCWVFLEMDLNKYVSLINLMGVDAYINKIGGLNPNGDEKYPGFQSFVNKLMENNELRAEVVNRWFKEIVHSDWVIMNTAEITKSVEEVGAGKNPTHLSLIFGYKYKLSNNAVTTEDKNDKENVTFMKAFGMPETVTQSMMDGDDAYKINGVSKSNFNTNDPKAPFKITFTAYAVQAAEMDSLEEAYDNIPTK